MPDNEDITYRYVAQAALWLLALIITGMCGLALSILSDHATRLNNSEQWMTKIQDSQNEYAWRVQKNEAAIDSLKSQKAESSAVTAQEAEIGDLKTELATEQRQLDTDQYALHTLSDAFTREFPLKRYR